MDSKRTKIRVIEEKITYATTNAEKLSLPELESIQSEARKFIQTLPKEKRGAFYWKNGLECLSMIISAIKNYN